MILRLLRDLYSLVLRSVLALLWAFTPRTRLPPISAHALTQSPVTLARWVRERKYSSESIVAAFVSRIKAVNPIINAVVTDRFDQALQEARDVDTWLATLTEEQVKELARSKPLLGVPFTTKESIKVKGMSHTHALKVRAGFKAEEDAQVIKLVRGAGGIPLCVTTVPELGKSYACYSTMFGITNNPYDIARTPGGSSGGEVALLASCGTPVSIGSDLGGSVRCPAAYCGTFAHKPTSSWVSLEGAGIYPSLLQPHHKVIVVGPLTRYAADLPFLMEIIAPEHAKDLTDKVNATDLTDINVWWAEDLGASALFTSTDWELRKAVHDVSSHLGETFRVPVKKWPCDMSKTFQIWANKMNDDFQGQPPITEDLMNRKGRLSLAAEIAKKMIGCGNFTAGTLQVIVLSKLLLGVKDPQQSPYYWRTKQKEVLDVLGDKGVLVMPVMPTLAPYHKYDYLSFMDISFTSVFNALELPATTVPLGLSKEGLPVAVQVASAPGNDHVTLKVAQALEERFGGWTPPCVVQEEGRVRA